MKIKICGLFREEDIVAVNEAHPDFIGFVFAPSRRQVTKQQAEKLKKILDANIQVVGVFVNAPQEEILSLLDAGIIDIIQLHGQENKQYIKELKAKTRCQIIKAVSVKTIRDIEQTQTLGADFLLLDQGAGGSGTKFSWEIVNQWEQSKTDDTTDGTPETPYFLAGGINTDNIQQAMGVGIPYAIDLSSGAETDGVKDKGKIVELIRRARNGSEDD